MSTNRVIGQQGGMPWHIPEDFKLFKRVTLGHALIMGRKTYESIGRPLPGRLNIVVTRQASWSAAAEVVVKPSLAEALAYAEGVAAAWGDEVFIIGGGELYTQTLASVRTIYQTVVPRQVDGDTYYPEVPPGEFRLDREEAGPGDIPFSWRVWKRR